MNVRAPFAVTSKTGLSDLNVFRFLQEQVGPWYESRRRELERRPLIQSQAFGGGGGAAPAGEPVQHSRGPDRRVTQNWLSNRVFATYDDIIDAACDAWRKLIAQPHTISSIGSRQWAVTGQT